jgi:hypothetical protein
MNYADLVKETTTATDTSTVTLLGAVAGYQSFATGFAALSTAIPVRLRDSTGAWICGLYTLTNSTTLTRTSILSSSNAGTDVTLAAGTKEVLNDVPALAFAGLIDQDDVGFDIILCAGQSNMEGNPASDPLIDVADSRIYQWANSAADTASYRKIIGGADPLYMPGGIRTGKTGPATWMAKAYLATQPSNRRVLLIPVAVGSTGLVGSVWAVGGTYYNRSITETNLAITAAKLWYPNSRFVGTIWAQGEADGLNGTTQAQYATGLKAVIAGFRANITGATNSWFVISGMTPEGITAHTGEVAINAAHIQVAAETDKVAMVPGFSGYAADVHYTDVGVRIMGSKLGLLVKTAKTSVGADVTAPTAISSAVANASPTVVAITMSEAIDAAYVPATSAFTVTGHTVSGVAISGSTINVTVSAGFVNGEAARTISYTQPGTSNARDLAGNLLANFASLAITNNVAAVDVTPPTFVSAQVADANKDKILITMSETLAATVPSTSAFTVSGGKTVSGVSIAGSVVTVTVNSVYAFGDTITVSYTQPGSSQLQDPSGNLVATFGATSVTNNIGAPATAPGAPTIGTATGGDMTASVPFTAPASNGGAAITSYTATSSPGSITGTLSQAGSGTISVTGLTNGTAYTFTVTATNSAGTSAASSASNSVTPNAAVSFNAADTAAGITLSNSNLTAAGTSGFKSTRSSTGKTTGKWYWEEKVSAGTVGIIGFGLIGAATSNFAGSNVSSWGYYTTGARYYSNTVQETLSTYTTNDVIGIALDMNSKTGQFYKNNVALGTAFTLTVSAGGATIGAGVAVYPMASPNGSTIAANFGAVAFAYTPPSGFIALTP